MSTKMIEVVCYDRIEKWHNRENAIDFYSQGQAECDGLEAERYANIVAGLVNGLSIAHDGYSLSYRDCKGKGRFHKTKASDGSRDLGGKIWF